MILTIGTRLASTTSDTEVVVVRAPASDLDLRCGGHPMRAIGSGEPRTAGTHNGELTQIGKRYVEEDLGLELLCCKAGEGPLTIGTRPLAIKGAKPLPSSD